MVSLVDIGDHKDTVKLRGQDVEIRGVTAKDIVGIFYKFPEVRMVLTQTEPNSEVWTTLIARAPDAVACLIAAACGAADDEKAITVAGGLAVGEQYDALQKIGVLTFPQGMQNFLDGVQKLLAKVDIVVPGWAPGTTLREPSKDASSLDETRTDAGEAPQDS
jgi:hypothetical protein